MRLVKLICIFPVSRWVYEERVTVLDCVRIYWEVFLCVCISMSPVSCPINADVIQCHVSSPYLHPLVDTCMSNISNFGYLFSIYNKTFWRFSSFLVPPSKYLTVLITPLLQSYYNFLSLTNPVVSTFILIHKFDYFLSPHFLSSPQH